MEQFTLKERIIIKLIIFLVEFLGRRVDGFWTTRWREVFDETNS